MYTCVADSRQSDPSDCNETRVCDRKEYGASGRRCRIQQDDQQKALLDLNSSNGTYLNGMQLFPGREYPVKNGDIIRMAISDFQIVME